MAYLLGQMLMCLLAAGLLGLLIGWLWWGLPLSKARERTSEMEQRVSKLSGFPSRMADLEATHAAFVASKNEEDARSKRRKEELEKTLAAKSSEWESTRQSLEEKFEDLHLKYLAAVSAAQEVPALTSRLHSNEAHLVQMQDLEERLDAAVGRAAELEAMLKEKDAEVAEHWQLHSDKDARLASLAGRIGELEPAARRLPRLQAAHAELWAAVEAKDTQIAGLTHEVDQHAAANAERTAGITELAAMAALAPQLKADLAMQAAALAEKDARIAELAEVKAETARVEPLKARAAAAAASAASGFYEVTPVAAVAYQAWQNQASQNHVLEFEKRIEDLRNTEARKDAEISKLSSRLTEIEGQVDPDVRRQILFAAKNAELTQMRGVLNALFQPIDQDEIARRAYSYAEARRFQGGSAVEDWVRAERDSHFVRLANAWESTRPGSMF
jgi:uncharacterized coiled-coil protein SlyX